MHTHRGLKPSSSHPQNLPTRNAFRIYIAAQSTAQQWPHRVCKTIPTCWQDLAFQVCGAIAARLRRPAELDGQCSGSRRQAWVGGAYDTRRLRPRGKAANGIFIDGFVAALDIAKREFFVREWESGGEEARWWVGGLGEANRCVVIARPGIRCSTVRSARSIILNFGGKLFERFVDCHVCFHNLCIPCSISFSS